MKSEKLWLIGLGVLSALFVAGGIFLSGTSTLDLHLFDTYYIIDWGKWLLLVFLWITYFFHLGLQTMSLWGKNWKTICILVLVGAILLNILVFRYFYATYMLPSAFDWPLDDEEAKKILLKQQDILRNAFIPVAVPICVIGALHVIRLIQLFNTKSSDADTGLPTA